MSYPTVLAEAYPSLLADHPSAGQAIRALSTHQLKYESEKARFAASFVYVIHIVQEFIHWCICNQLYERIGKDFHRFI
jgi:hypothetical protein